ncbi:hypothetical protein O6H91_17G087700 [Diphasiastrum complanatum]|uniref:Uncharacterized protein n=1 Tax=Diphasiastrum complanatum TaxID=34168 RepID=A0ACC2B8X9_DIPCM|nr:hypothetical protein O6H91_Y189400 [Diphasiastrum complanatum]KAJ7526206.1 hypothetical protein O6H91_17G087700 [Diphasiastrum complanatum]
MSSLARRMRQALVGLLIISLALIQVNGTCDDNALLDKIVPCVSSGTVQAKPSPKCCTAIKSITLACFCSLITSATGSQSPKTVQTYIKDCTLKVPPHFKC